MYIIKSHKFIIPNNVQHLMTCIIAMHSCNSILQQLDYDKEIYNLIKMLALHRRLNSLSFSIIMTMHIKAVNSH